MTSLSYTVPVAGTTLNSVADPEVATALTSILAWSTNIDGTNVAATLTGRRLVGQAAVIVTGFTNSGTYYIGNQSPFASGSTTQAAPIWWYLDPANFAITGKTNTQAVLRVSLSTNATASGITATYGLNAVTFAGGGNFITPTLGASSASVAFATPAASSALVAETSTFAFPTAGAYAPSVTLSGTSATNSILAANLQLFALNS